MVDGRLELVTTVREGRLGLAAGPFATGQGREMLERMSIPGLGNVLERLADVVRVEATADGTAETLVAAFDY